jgi:hypothetical protein
MDPTTHEIFKPKTFLLSAVKRFPSDLNTSCGRDSSVGIATALRAGRSGDRIPVRGGGARFSAPVQTAPLGGPSSLLYNAYWVFPEDKAAGAWR